MLWMLLPLFIIGQEKLSNWRRGPSMMLVEQRRDFRGAARVCPCWSVRALKRLAEKWRAHLSEWNLFLHIPATPQETGAESLELVSISPPPSVRTESKSKKSMARPYSVKSPRSPKRVKVNLGVPPR